MDNTEINAQIAKALQLHQAGQFDQAEPIYLRILQHHPNHSDSLHFLGVLKHQRGQNDTAIPLIRQAIGINPNVPVYYNNLAAAFKATDDLDNALKCYRQAVALNPRYAEAYCNMGVILKCQSKSEEAAAAYKTALNLSPDYAEAHKNLGGVYDEQNRSEDALRCYEKFIQYQPNQPDPYFRVGFLIHRQGKYEEAIAYYRKALELKPDYIEAYNNMGAAIKELGDYDEAIACYRKLLEIQPDHAKAISNMGVVYQEKHEYDTAIACYEKSIALEPNYSEAYNNIGTAKKDRGELDDAEKYFRKAIEIQPDYAEAHNNLGVLLQSQDRLAEAIPCFERAISLKPDYVEAFYNQAIALQGLNRLDEAVSAYRNALNIKPDYADATCRMYHQMLHLADWRPELQALASQIGDMTALSLSKGEKPAEASFENLCRVADPAQNVSVAKAAAQNLVRLVKDYKVSFSYDINRSHSKIIIGYVSNDFCNHPVAYQMLSLFGLHDRSRFQINCYSYGHDDKSIYRKKIQTDCDQFIDIRKLSIEDAAKKIHEDQVDILVDLMGYTKGHRLGICALRPAPIQVMYLGYPGTSGADFFDYLITDKIVSPPQHAEFYAEKLVYMPDTYMVNDYQRPIGIKEWRRKDFGLPSDGIVFCSFNRPYKIEPKLFDVWMRILKQVPNSVLWLERLHPVAETNLKNEARQRGVDPDRLIFSDKLVSKDEHTARQPLADIALDTLIYNGHATTNDALWVGVPVIAMTGTHFASRASASFLHAVGLPELIVENLESYENLAVNLAANPDKLTLIRQKLAKNRLTEPLFDTPRFVRHLEDAYQQMWKLFLSDKKPEAIAVQSAKCKVQSVKPKVFPSEIGRELMAACQAHQQGRFEEAEPIYRKVLSQFPDQPDALHLLGVIAHQKGDHVRSVELISKAVSLNPDDYVYYNNLGAAYKHLGQANESLAAYRKCAELKPDFAEVYYNMAILISETDKAEDSVAYYEKSISLKPDYHEAIGNLLYQLATDCDWQKIDRYSAQIGELMRKAISGEKTTALMPFISIIQKDDPKQAFDIARKWCEGVQFKVQSAKCKVKSPLERGQGCVKIGYMSSDFRNHPVGSQMQSLFALHNREKFRIFCYSFGNDDGSIYRRRIEKECDVFADMQNMSYEDAATRMSEDRIDILVDLMGHTKGNRLNVLAYRPAKIQVSWLGFPGTLGAAFMDYIITDRITTPESHAPFYSEKLAYLPHTYMVNDHTLSISPKHCKRSDFGLPEDGFVFCSFNRSYKIEPVMFDAWMDILKAVPGSVLWLRRVSEVSEKNLRMEAEKRGVSRNRLIFTSKVPTKEEHLARHGLADLALDTRIYNGHATTNDALFAGVPVITLQGNHFASRAASSFLSAIGLTELITHSLEDYKSLAIRLAQQPDELMKVRQKLAKNRLTHPLFDTPRFVRDLENLYLSCLNRDFQDSGISRIEEKSRQSSNPVNHGSDNHQAEIRKALQLHQSGQLNEAQAVYEKILEKSPNHADALNLSGLAAFQSGNPELAKHRISKAIQIAPQQAMYYNNLGVVLQSQSELNQAIACYQKAIALQSDFAQAHCNIGLALRMLDQPDEALKYFEKTLQLNPNHADAKTHAAQLYSVKGYLFRDNNIDEAISCLRKALQLNPNNAESLNNLGIFLRMQNQLQEAEECFRKALEIRPEFPEALFNISAVFRETEGLEEAALSCLRKAVQIKPDYTEAVFSLLQHCKETCTWQNFDALSGRAEQILKQEIARGIKPSILVFNHLAHWDDPESNLAIAKVWAESVKCEVLSVKSSTHNTSHLTHNTSKLTIGYVSGDFRNHPVGHLISAVFGRHERKRFRVIAYSFGRDDGSLYRKRAEQDCDQFTDISTLSDQAAAERIRQDGVDILIDLMGQTRGSRMGIFAMKPAPLQLTWLGYPGTSGASFFDFLIADPIVIPQDSTRFYSEKLAYMPHAYLITDNTQPISAKPIQRADVGLPEHAFVFCSFNRPYKIDPKLFDVWMSVLKQVPNSVLWLKRINGLAEKNLKAEAAARGVNPDRLIFAPKWESKEEHLARLRLADLVLDTKIFNGHSTSADALWVGVPVITILGKHFASRVCSSLLNAVGLPELITRNLQEYETLALRLAHTPMLLQQIRQKLAKNRLTHPLFDTNRFVRNLERLYEGVWESVKCQVLSVKKEDGITPDTLHLTLEKAFAYQNAGKLAEAERICQQILGHQPDQPDALHLLGIIAYGVGKHQQSLELIHKAIRIFPHNPTYYNNLGTICKSLNRLGDAERAYRKAIEIKPDFAEAIYNLGNVLKAGHRMEEAFACYHKAVQIKPDYADAYNNLGTGLKDMERLEEAIVCFRKAIEVKPDFAEVHYNLGCALKDLGKLDQAIFHFHKVIELNPNFTDVYDNLAHQYQHACDWKAYHALLPKIEALNKDRLSKGLRVVENPFSHVSRYADPAYNFEIIKSWAESVKCQVESVKWQVLSVKEKDITPNTSHLTHKNRIGYLSNDFRNHPVAHLIAGLFKAHNREQFEIFCYSYGRDDGSVHRQRIRHDCDKFIDLLDFNDEDAAKRIAEDKIDILIDLMGHTKSNRLGICAYHPAKIQATWLGFPGTSGAKFFEYMITDKTVTPEDHAKWCSEQLVFMPHCYQINDHCQPFSEKRFSRKEFGLPESGFVFCSFNQAYKIEPIMFDVWMKLLREVPGSVLWLLQRSDLTEINLKREAEKRGVNPNRLIFSPKMHKDEHLSRHVLADLVLDTRIYNGHTTTSDALWAGVPVIGIEGTHFASRVCASILKTIGLPQLIAKNLQEYESLALKLAKNPDTLNRIRQQIARNRLTEPLFDTPRFARNLENAYLEMWRIFQAGEMPRPIHVSESGFKDNDGCKDFPAISPPESSGSGLTTDQAFIQMAQYNNMGTSLQAQRRTDEAIAYFKKALEIMPSFTAIYNNLGLAYSDKGSFDEALKSFQKVVEADPNYSKAYYNMGNLYQSRGFLDDAIRCYRKAIELEPDYVKAYSSLFHRLRYICEWKDLPQMAAALDRIADESFAKGERCDETPFINITRDTNPHRNFVMAKAWGDEISKRMESFKKEVNFNVTHNTSHLTPNTKLKIGYISADFRNHPVAHLMLELFGAHSRQEFEIFCYSYSEDNGGHYRKHIEQSCDKFVDILRMSHTDAAKRIYEDGVDILVDLMGHTTNCRLEICALRPARIQCTWLGYPGTTGADFFDYIITDQIVSPQEHAPYYSEKFIYMPDCYMINNRVQPISDRPMVRAHFGLPSDVFVFCSFNQVYKFEPVMFDVWMRLLGQVSNSVLWLPTRNGSAEQNLRQEAQNRGVHPNRLIFSPILADKSEHLARIRLADLGLDTRLYNGHATTSDALWGGLPVVTLQGTHFASRAASSLLTAIGLPDLIARSLQEYESLALKLALNPEELKKVRQRLEKNRYTEPLFDTPRFARNLEAAYRRIWEIYKRGESPR